MWSWGNVKRARVRRDCALAEPVRVRTHSHSPLALARRPRESRVSPRRTLWRDMSSVTVYRGYSVRSDESITVCCGYMWVPVLGIHRDMINKAARAP